MAHEYVLSIRASLPSRVQYKPIRFGGKFIGELLRLIVAPWKFIVLKSNIRGLIKNATFRNNKCPRGNFETYSRRDKNIQLFLLFTSKFPSEQDTLKPVSYECTNFFRGKGRNRKRQINVNASTTDTNHAIKASQSVLLMLIEL